MNRWLLLGLVLLLTGCARTVDPRVLRAGGDWSPPPAYHGNPFGFGGVGAAYHFVFEPLFSYVPETGQWLPRLGLSYEDEGRTTTVHLRPDNRWHDGSPVTAEDVRANLLLLILRGHPVGEFCSRIEVVDPLTLRFHWRYLTEDLKTMVLAELVYFPAKAFPGPLAVVEDFRRLGLQREQEAPPELQKRMAEARQQLLRYRPELASGTGPFRMTRVTASEMVFEKFAQHPLASRLDYDQLRVFRIGSNEVGWAMLLSNQLDFVAMACPIDLTAEIQRKNPNYRVALPADGNEVGFILNSRRLAPALRQALILALDRDGVRRIAFPYGETVDDRGLGVLASLRSKWLTAEELATFQPRSHQPEQARQILEKAGYRLVEGRWHDAAGQPLALTVTCRGGYTDFILMAEVAAAQWDRFGIATQIRVVPPDLYPTLLTAGDFQVTATFGVMHGRFVTPVAGLERFFYPGNEVNKAMGLPPRLEVDGERFSSDQLIRSLRREEDPTRLRRGVYLLSRALYDQAVYLPVFEKRNPMFYAEGPVVHGWPDNQDPTWSNVVCGAEQTFLDVLLFDQ
ncbi:MAG: ABC transporter substrate-binding protein [Vulcanimicrobiota bacterium]